MLNLENAQKMRLNQTKQHFAFFHFETDISYVQ